MSRFNSLIVVGLLLGAMPPAQAQQTSDFEGVHATSRRFVAAIVARDINTMDTVWAHESYASFIGPLSTTVVVGWDGVRQAWQMRFGQFDRVTISADKPHKFRPLIPFRSSKSRPTHSPRNMDGTPAQS